MKINDFNFIPFSFFQKFYRGFLQYKLKKNGRFNTIHHEALKGQSSIKIQGLVALLTELMQPEKQGDDYEALKNRLPTKFRKNWWRLLPFAAIFIFNQLTARRAVEGLPYMKKDHFAKLYDEETNTYAYEEVVGGLSKNNRFTDQDLRFGGCIPYENMEMGKNLF